MKPGPVAVAVIPAVALILFGLGVFDGAPSNTGISLSQRDSDASEREYDSLTSKVEALEVQKLIARRIDPGTDNSDIDKKLSVLKSRLALLQSDHDRVVELRRTQAAQKETDARRQQEEAETKRAMQEQEALMKAQQAFQRRCDSVRNKRFADLTPNDAELLRQCGSPVPTFRYPE